MSTGSSNRPQTAEAGCRLRLRPSWPERPPSPLAASSSGVWIVPAAIDDRVRLDGDPPAVLRARLDRDGPRPAHHEPLRARARARERARGARGHEIGVAGVLLGAGRAAEGAHAAALAAARVAPQVAARPAEPLGAAARQRGVRAGQLGRDLGDAERLLDAVEHRGERGGGERVEAELRAPAVRARGPACGSRCPSSRAWSRRSRGRAAARSGGARASRSGRRRGTAGPSCPAAGRSCPRRDGPRPPRARRRARRPRRAPWRPRRRPLRRR